MIKSGSLNGQANPAEWTLEINASLLQGSAVEVNRFARLADTAAHEGRHGLQIIRAARLDPSGNVKNGLRHDIATLLTTGTYKGKTLEALTPGTEARADAQKFFDSLMGGGAAHRTQVYDRMDDARSKMKDLWTQIETARKSPTSTRSAKVKLMAQLHAEHQRLIQAHRDYKALPEESDAWRYGGEVGVSVSRSLKRRFGKLAEQNDRHSTTMSQALARQQAILSGLGGARVTGGLTGIQLDKFEKTLDKYFAALSRAQKVNAKSRALWEKVHSDTRSADESL